MHLLLTVIRVCAIMILISLPFSRDNCDPKDETAGDTDTNNDVSTYVADFISPLPFTYDCNVESKFTFTVDPTIEVDDLEISNGLNRIYVTLVDLIGIEYKTNYVQFNSANLGQKELEFGGALPSGLYQVILVMHNINSGCSNEIAPDTNLCATYYCQDQPLDVTEFINPSRVMSIEYYCQDWYNILTSTPQLKQYMDNAFFVANTKCSLTIYNTNLTNEYIYYDPDTLANYIESIRIGINNPKNMMICGIKGFKDSTGVRNSPLGISLCLTSDDQGIYYPAITNGCLIADEHISAACEKEYNWSKHELMRATVIHELGHSRCRISHHYVTAEYNWDKRYCIMTSKPIVYQPVTYKVYNNNFSIPHFCDSCLQLIRDFPSWGG